MPEQSRYSSGIHSSPESEVSLLFALSSLLNLELIVVPDQTPQETLDSLQRQSPAIMIFNSDREGKYGDIENLLFRDAKQQR